MPSSTPSVLAKRLRRTNRHAELFNLLRESWLTAFAVVAVASDIYQPQVFSIRFACVAGNCTASRVTRSLTRPTMLQHGARSARLCSNAGALEPGQLFCNLYLHPFDQALTNKHIPFVRYADDLPLFTETESQARAPMGRVVDVAGLGGMRTGPGQFAARISDPVCPWNEGAWSFETADGALHVTRTGKAGCDLAIQGLSALVYGTHDPGDFCFQGWGDPPPQVQAAMRAVFPPLTPYLHEYF